MGYMRPFLIDEERSPEEKEWEEGDGGEEGGGGRGGSRAVRSHSSFTTV